MPGPRRIDRTLDVRGMRKPDKHPAIFAAYDALSPGEAFTLVNDHDPRHLREEFDADIPGCFSWDYVSREPRDWRIRIGKLTTSPPPRVVADGRHLLARTAGSSDSGAIWTLSPRDHELEVIALPPTETDDIHVGRPEQDASASSRSDTP